MSAGLRESIARNMSKDSKTINSAQMTACEIEEVAGWLIGGARSEPQPVQVLAQLSERLVACGIPLWRVAVFVRTLHPQVWAAGLYGGRGLGSRFQRRHSSFSRARISSRIRLRMFMRPAKLSAASSPTRIVRWIFRFFRKIGRAHV